MRVALLDLFESSKGCNNKEVTGTYGSSATGEGGISSLFAWAKRRQLKMPMVHMAYLNAIFKSKGHDVTYCESPPKVVHDLVLMATSIIGASEERAAAASIKENFPSTRIGFFGAFASVDVDEFLRVGDFVIQGEPEQLCQEIAEGMTFPEGLVASEKIKDLDNLPNPDYRGFPVSDYSYAPLLKNRPFLPITTTRGCPYDCFYCPYMVNQGKYFRKHSVQRVIEQIEESIRYHNINSILFRDIVFTINKKRTRELCELIIDRNIKIQWGCETRIDCLDEDLIRLMRRAGCECMHFGIESSDNNILAEAGRRGMELDSQRQAVNLCESIGIKTVCFYILGFVSDTNKSMKKTMEYACSLNSSVAQFGIMTPYPGTRLFEQLEDRLLTRNWSAYNTYTPVVRLDNLSSEEVIRAKRLAYQRYYLRPVWITKRLPNLLF